MIKPAKQTRRIRRWRVAAMSVNILLLSVFVLSLRWNFGVGIAANGANQSGAYLVGVENGAIMLSRSSVTQLPSVAYAGCQRRMQPVVWIPTYVGSWVGRFLHVPFWIAAVPSALWGVWIWRRRHFEPGCPMCGYDLAGLQGTICPECGLKGVQKPD